ncbi:hypothetical protein Nepgr_028193 [Nepenthes gracilis]|uniref:Uncharacterized protein n=1 Tax=Nepenthes gracilis TaxID=150966 RepID=A0AAD3TB92_NEPGR|nr:hypothetical protein Nepgr_028193 [Nepenthes gracilis]
MGCWSGPRTSRSSNPKVRAFGLEILICFRNSKEVVFSMEEMTGVHCAKGRGIFLVRELLRAEIVPNGRGELRCSNKSEIYASGAQSAESQDANK